WQKLTPGPSRRVPSILIESLERSEREDEPGSLLDMPDRRAEQALLAVEQEEIATLVLRLPAYLRSVVWLIFWEDHTMKTVSRLLNISERTVRNRLRAALELLRAALESEQEVIDGRSA
ncbi:MAG TPA: sigma factor-like helix-turn-helix DNA-binding protein, partial [Ktedonobacteraceae bacterium]|nr:sigma factor-like helix-turn-helix DNA-binding protein [Ktedonobacteraceae bacterium]